jgi:lipid-A-disaccharide synthase
LSAKGARQALDVFLVAGEASGDQLGASLMKKLRERFAAEIRFRGVGGPVMASEGLVSLFPMDDVTAMGFGSVIRKLPLILRRIRETVAAIAAAPPDALILIDSPDFNQRVARRVRRMLPALPIVKYVSPTVWVWRPGRARKLTPLVDHVLALFPFEPDVLKKLGGPPSSYVGHPLLERIGELRASPEDERARENNPPLLLVLPGSRRLEIQRLAKIFGEAIGLLAQKRGPLNVVLPTLRAREEEVRAAVESWPLKPRIVVIEAEKYATFRRARGALGFRHRDARACARACAHGCRLSRPAVGGVDRSRSRAGKLSHPAEPRARRKRGAEFLQRDCTAKKLAEALVPLFSDTPERRRQLGAFKRLDQIFSTDGEQPSDRAARLTLEAIENKRKSMVEEIHS